VEGRRFVQKPHLIAVRSNFGRAIEECGSSCDTVVVAEEDIYVGGPKIQGVAIRAVVSSGTSIEVYGVQTERTTIGGSCANCIKTPCTGGYKQSSCCDKGLGYGKHYCQANNMQIGNQCQENIECEDKLVCRGGYCRAPQYDNPSSSSDNNWYKRYDGTCTDPSLFHTQSECSRNDCARLAVTYGVFVYDTTQSRCWYPSGPWKDGQCRLTSSPNKKLYVLLDKWKRIAGESDGLTTYIIIFGVVAAVVCVASLFFYVRKQKAKGNRTAQPRRIEGPNQQRSRTQRTAPRE